jgi:hypothetical protein
MYDFRVIRHKFDEETLQRQATSLDEVWFILVDHRVIHLYSYHKKSEKGKK